MNISLTTEGGWTAGLTASPKSISLADLDSKTKAKIFELVENLHEQDSMERKTTGEFVRDDMTFIIQIELDNQPTQTFRERSTELSADFAELLGIIQKAGS